METIKYFWYFSEERSSGDGGSDKGHYDNHGVQYEQLPAPHGHVVHVAHTLPHPEHHVQVSSPLYATVGRKMRQDDPSHYEALRKPDGESRNETGEDSYEGSHDTVYEVIRPGQQRLLFHNNI